MSNVDLFNNPTENNIRDAIHIPIISLPAGEWLTPSIHVRIYNGQVVECDSSESIGIVNPYLDGGYSKGDLVWILLKPNTITSLKHVWEHPGLNLEQKKPPTKEESEAWLRNFCEKSDCPEYDVLIKAATNDVVESLDSYYEEPYRIDNEYLLFLGRNAYGTIPFEFWEHVENVTGKKCLYRPKRFSCSC